VRLGRDRVPSAVPTAEIGVPLAAQRRMLYRVNKFGRLAPASVTSRTTSRARNPLGLDPVTVREIDGTRVKVGPIEAFDGTPVVDIKSASTRADG
jgi:hypothetical protein